MSAEFISYRYKDENPLRTINKIREILGAKNILVKESWNNIGNTAYSVHLTISGTTITANGKGISIDLALASAYGELVERLSLLLPFRVSLFYTRFYEVIVGINNNSGLFYENDFEQWIFSECADQFFDQLAYRSFKGKRNDFYRKRYSKEDLKKFWQNRFRNSSEFKIASTFNELKLQEEQNYAHQENMILPLSIVDYYYGSNGMCAGNSFEEALVQGISEIVERYVQKKIILGEDVKCYDITASYLSSVNELDSTIEKLTEAHLSLTLLECVSEISIPVIAAILKKPGGEYYVSFGCHPCINVSVERTITELLQGYNLQTLNVAFSDRYLIQSSKAGIEENYMNIVKFGKGLYPIEFICKRHPPKNIDKNADVFSNRILLEQLCNVIHMEGYKIYLCSGIDMGLFCYHVIIPGLSEVQDLFPHTKIRNDNMVDTYGQLEELEANEAYQLAELCATRWNNGEKYLEQLISVDKYREYTDCHTAAEGISAALFICLLYIKAKNFPCAIEYIDHFCKEVIDDTSVGIEELAYYRMVRTILEMLQAGWDENRICQAVDADKEIQMLVSSIYTGENIFEDIPDLAPEGLLRESTSLASVVKEECDLLYQLLMI